MLTAEGCRKRRKQLWQKLNSLPDIESLVLGDPIHLRYFANFDISPISLSGECTGLLLMSRDGTAKLICDNVIPTRSVDRAHVDARIRVNWYDFTSPAAGPRQLVLAEYLTQTIGTSRIHDHPSDLLGPQIVRIVSEMRRSKDADEIDLLRTCMAAGKVGQDWARRSATPGMTEMDVYSGICSAVNRYLGRHVVVYGDFAVSTGPDRTGGPPTDRALAAGDMLILDFSVILDGYRSDFTNTLVVGAEPSADQRRLFDLCYAALQVGERALSAGTACQGVYDAVIGKFSQAGVAEHFPHHAGHGLGLQHPEAPYFVQKSTETLMVGDVVTLEPGLYVPGVGGVRIEHNYLITDSGFERLSDHDLGLK